MKEIPLTQSKIAIVDDDMFEELSKHKWYFEGRYAARISSLHLGKQKLIRMHRTICSTPDGMETDHINGDKLDNRRENLRICTRAENSRNKRKRAHNTSGYKGVYWYKQDKKWEAQIEIEGKNIHLGYFEDLLNAARAYDAAAIKLHGSFARTNFQEVNCAIRE